MAIPIKSKKGPHVAGALERAFKVMKPPRKLQTDMGKEFYNFHIKRVLNRYRVHHFSTDQPLKARTVERFHRTLKETLKQLMAYRKSLDYISVLSNFLFSYNARPHTAFLLFAPREVNKNNEAWVHELQYGEYLRQQKAKYKYSVGDHVRKAINKGAFSRSYKFKNFSEKLYEIIDTVHTNAPNCIRRKCQGWSLRNILKPFYSKENGFLINDHVLNLVVNNNFKINRKVIDKKFVKTQIARYV